MSKKLYIKTYGCQMNTYDSDKMVELLKPLGFEVTDTPKDADLAILNTCHIRDKAEQKVYSDLGRLHKHQKAAQKEGRDVIIAVAGCVAQAAGEEILRQAPYVSMVFGPQTYHRLPEYLMRKAPHLVDTEFPVESKFDFLPQTAASKTSAFISIQEGCDKFCTFCCVPYTRGAEFSRPVQAVLDEAHQLIDLGVIEITLLGQNVNAYHGEGPDGKEWGLAILIEELAKIKGLLRIRYTTSHPRDMDDALIQAHVDIPQLMPYLHLPVQSGSDLILKAMNRKHTIARYHEIMNQIKSKRSDILVSSDFIAGFPGETDEDHRQTVQLILDYIDTGYSFCYSPRPGTPASVADNQIPEEIKKQRLHEIQEALTYKQLQRNQADVGKIMPVLVEKTGRKENQMIGKSPYLQSVCFQGKSRLLGSIVDIKITAGYANTLEGDISILSTDEVA